MYQRLKRLLPIILWPIFIMVGWLSYRRYRHVNGFVSFIGYPRSGHTLVGSLMDAHPNVVVSIEANAFQLIQLGYYRSAILLFVEFWSKFVSKILGNRWSGYSYRIKGGDQGRSEKILIMGDNDANQTIQRILDNGNLPERFQRKLKLPVQYIHVIRNPFDIITTMHNRKIGNFDRDQMATINNQLDRVVLEKKIRTFFRKAEEIEKRLSEGSLKVLNVHHSNLINDPKKELARIFSRIQIEADPEFLSLCSQTIHKSSNFTRSTIDWPEDLKSDIESKCRQISFLKDYTFAN